LAVAPNPVKEDVQEKIQTPKTENRDCDDDAMAPPPAKKRKVSQEVLSLDSDSDDAKGAAGSLTRRIAGVCLELPALQTSSSRSGPDLVPRSDKNHNGSADVRPPLAFCPRPSPDVIDLLSDDEETKRGSITPSSPQMSMSMLLNAPDFFVTPPASDSSNENYYSIAPPVNNYCN